VLESALDGEITDHLGHDRPTPGPRTVRTTATAAGPRRCGPR
jgi:hypothetical protein